jgi:hypothetical protein
VVIPCGTYLPHGALVEIFTLSWAVERWNLSSVSLLLSLLLKSIGENMIAMILWFLNIRHSGTLFGMWFLTSAQQLLLLILPSIGSAIVPSHSSQWFWKGFLKWTDGGGENGITSNMIFELEVSFSSQNVNFPFIWGDVGRFFLSFFELHLLRTWGFDDIWGENTSSKTSF